MTLNPTLLIKISINFLKLYRWAVAISAMLCFAPANRLIAQVAQVSLSAPQSALLGEAFSFQLSLDNSDASVIGYDPIVELMMPSLPANDGEDLFFPAEPTLSYRATEASYLGNPIYVQFVGFVDTTTGTIENPVTKQLVSGPAGAGLYILHYPLSSVSPNQPAPVITVEAQVHALAPITLQAIQARGIFNDGGDPSGGSEPVYGATVEALVVPSLLQLTKRVSYAESETATGPSFPGKWSLIGNVALEASLAGVVLTDVLPNDFQVTNVNLVRPVGGELSLTGAEPGGLLQVSWAAVSGAAVNAGSEILIEVEGYMAEYDSSGTLVLSTGVGENQSINAFTSVYQFERVGIDPLGGLNVADSSNAVVVDTLSVALQKDASIVADVLPSGLSPEDTVEFSLNLQVSDFKAVDQLQIMDGSTTTAGLSADADILGDGLTFDGDFVPTYTVTMGGVTLSGVFEVNNYSVTLNPEGHPLGSSRLTFDLSQQLMEDAQFASDGILTGAALLGGAGSGTVAQIRYRALIDVNFDSPESGDASVDIADLVFNDVDVVARDLIDSILVGDASGVALKMKPIGVSHTIQRIVSAEGVVTELPSGTPYVSPGDQVTFALRFSVPTGDVEDLLIRDFLPYSMLSVVDVNGDGVTGDALQFNPLVSSSPEVGQLTYGDADEYLANFSEYGAPIFSISQIDNSFALDYGSIDSPSLVDHDGNGVYEFEFYYTLVAGADQLPDGYKMTSLAQLTHGSTNAGTQDRRAYAGLLFSRSEPVLTKGVVACDNSQASIQPVASGLYEYAGANGDLSGASAGDAITFAITVSNIGSDPIAVLNLIDSLPAGLDASAARIVSVRRADGSSLSMVPAVDGLLNSADEQALFSTGLVLNGSVADNYLASASGLTGVYGAETLVLILEVPIIESIAPDSLFENQATAQVWYAPGLPLSGPYAEVSDTASIRVESMAMEKAVIAGYTGDDASTVAIDVDGQWVDIFTIGEIVTYELEFAVPAGVATNTVLTDPLPAGLELIAVNGVRAEVVSINAAITSSALAAGANDVNSASVQASSSAVQFHFGTLSRPADAENAVKTIRVRLHALVQDDAWNSGGLQQLNTATLSWQGGSAVASSEFTVVRPNLVLQKSMQPIDGGFVQGGTTIQVDLTLSNLGAAQVVSAAHDFILEDLVQSAYFNTDTVVAVETPVGFVFETVTAADGVTVRYSGGEIGRDETHAFRFHVDLVTDLALLTPLQNTAVVNGTSLPGIPFSQIESTETATDLSSLRTATPAVTKSVLSTSEAHTSDQPLRVTIGERLVYRLRVDVPDGVVPAMQLIDKVPAGMDFVGSNSDVNLSFSGLGYAISGPMAALMAANFQGLSDADPSPSDSSGNDGDGVDVTWGFASITNTPDEDDTNDYFNVDLEMVVLDVPSVVGGSSPKVLKNRARIVCAGMQGNEGWSTRVKATVAEPEVLLAKNIPESALEGGDRFTVQLSVSNHGTADAYDLVVEDPIPGAFFKTDQIIFSPSNPAGWELSLDSAVTDGSEDTMVRIVSQAGVALEPGEVLDFEFSIPVDDAIPVASSILNTASVTQATSLDDSLTHPAGIDERDSGGATASDDIVMANADLQLAFESTSEADTSDVNGLPALTIGERAILRVDVDLPDGTFVAPTLVLDLPAGLDFVGGNSSLAVAYPGLGYDGFYGSLGAAATAAFSRVEDGDPSPTTSMLIDGSGVDVRFVFNTLVNLPDGDSSNDDFHFYVEVVCVDEVALVGYGDTPSELSVGVRMLATNAAADAAAGGVAFQVAEPWLSIDKTMLGMSADRPDVVAVSVAVSNDGASPAHDLTIADELDPSLFDLESVVAVEVPEGYVFANESGRMTLQSESASLAVGASVRVSFEVAVLAAAPSPLINTAVVTTSSSLNHSVTQPAGIGERAGAAIEDVAQLGIPALFLSKKVMDLDYTGEPLRAGDQIEYTLTVTNLGGAGATAVELLDSIPESTAYVAGSMQINGESVEPSLPDLSIDLGSLAAGASQVVVFTVQVDAVLPVAARVITNSASVTFAERTLTVISDNDPTGHDPVIDDGVDDALDAGEITSDDDPTQLPLLQAAISEHCYLAFEDLKNRGWSDWDHNDLLLDITTHTMTDGAGNVDSVIVVYQIIARGAAYEAEVYLTLPYADGGAWKTEYLEADGTFISSATGVGDGSMTAQVYASTREALVPYAEGRYAWGASRTERFDPTEPGRRGVVHLTLDNPSANPLVGFSKAPHDTWAHMVTSGEDVHRVEYELGNTQIVLEGPLAGRSLPLVVEFADGFDWPAETMRIYDSHPDYVDYIKSGGTSSLDWWKNYNEELIWVDANGNAPGVANELVSSFSLFSLFSFERALQALSFGAEPSPWPKTLGGLIAASPVLRDLTGDGLPEILISSMDGKVSIYDHDGNGLPGWPQAVDIRPTGNISDLALRASPAVGDIDGDGELDIVVGAPSGRLYAWSLDGARKSRFPVYLGGAVRSVCTVVDLDGDDAAEIVVHSGNSQLHVVTGAGESLAGWPQNLGGDVDQFGSWLIGSSPVVFDLKLDGSLQIAVGSSADKVHIFNVDGSSVAGWPATTGDWIYPSVTVVDLDGDYEPEIVVGSGDHQVYAWTADSELVAGFPVELDAAIIGSVATADLDGDGDHELVAATMSGAVYALSATGEVLEGWPQSADGAIVASPIIVDVDGDDLLDVIVASRDNWLYSWSAGGEPIAAVTIKSNDWIESTPAAGDLDGDGKIELVYASYDRLLNVLDLVSDATVGNLAWPAFRGDRATVADSVATDSDGDDLPDALELAVFGSFDFSGGDDSDGDGTSNFAEWIAGTSLEDPEDHFTVNTGILTVAEANRFELTWSGRAGRSYKVYGCASLGEGDQWVLVEASAIQYANGATEMSWQTILLSGVPCQFFRVIVERGDARE
jgi:LruC domain-containing protein/uncharacterized repeat protein (TIGR01451 family)/fimbrial isopeptide formation D2 family protein